MEKIKGWLSDRKVQIGLGVVAAVGIGAFIYYRSKNSKPSDPTTPRVPSKSVSFKNTSDISKYVDHTNLSYNATKDEIQKLTDEAQKFKFNSICVRTMHVKAFASQYRLSATIGFPKDPFEPESFDELMKVKEVIGNVNVDEKLKEAEGALQDGALEIDPVMPVCKVASKISDIKEELTGYFNLLRKYE